MFHRDSCRLLAPLCLVLALGGCASVYQRFPQDVAASFARDDMQRLETELLEVYYPGQHKEAAHRIAARLQQCAGKLRALQTTQRPRDKFLVFLTSSDFNNAYVQPLVMGNPQQMVLPLHLSLESFDLFDIGTNAVGDVACHEAVHYVTSEQIEGFWRGINFLFGGLFNPQNYLDSWTHEGMATWYEARLGKAVGRPRSPYWRGAFASGIASEEGLDPGFLHPESRLQDGYGPAYLTGLAFVDYLAERYGEEKLWQLVDKQARSFFSPLGVTLRFKSVYGLSIGALFDEFVAQTKQREAKRKRPTGQAALASEIGAQARLAVAPDGTLATISSGPDEVARLTLREKDGTVRASRRLTRVLPFRHHIVASPMAMSGLSFSADSKWLYLVAADLASDESFTSRLWKVDASDGSIETSWDDVTGIGGCLTHDGRAYVYAAVAGDVVTLTRLEFPDGKRTALTSFPPGLSVSGLSCSPADGRIAFSQRSPRGADLYLRAEDGTITRLTEDGRFNTQARFLDAGHLLFLREAEGRTQAHVVDLATRNVWATTDAPWGVVDPMPFGQLELAFLNREGWGFSLDHAPLVLVAPGAAPALAPIEPEELGGMLASAARATEPTAPGAPVRFEPPPSLKLLSDGPASQLDHLFIPSLRIPYVMLLGMPSEQYPDDPYRFEFALSLQGGDRLGYHAWALNLAYDTADNAPSVSLGYGNALLAPWYVDLSGALINVGPAYDRMAMLGFSRTFWTTPVRLHLMGLDHHDVDADTSSVVGRYRFVGAGLAAAYLAGETTAYGSIRRGLGLAVSGSYYPEFAASDYDLADVAAQVDLWVPLPISRRHSLWLQGRGRALLAQEQHPLLEVGGFYRSSVLHQFDFTATPRAGEPLKAADGGVLGRPQLEFAEVLRGYPDVSSHATAYAVASASYTYPIVIDHGWASLLYVLPAFFIRQIDVEVFGEWAWLWPGVEDRRSAGGAIHLRTVLGNLPLTLYVEGVARFDMDRSPFVLVGFAYE